MQVLSLGGEDSLEKEMATHSSILAWEIPWTEEPGELQSMGSLKSRMLSTEYMKNLYMSQELSVNPEVKKVVYYWYWIVI